MEPIFAPVFDTMEFVLRAPRTLAIAAMLAVMVSVTLAATVTGAHRGMCGDGDVLPSCAMFAVGLSIYGMIGLSALTTLATLVTYAVRRHPPALLKTASVLSVAAVVALVLPVRVAGNKFAGAIVVMMFAPIVLTLLAGATLCVLLWLGKVAGVRKDRRAGASAGLSQNVSNLKHASEHSNQRPGRFQIQSCIFSRGIRHAQILARRGVDVIVLEGGPKVNTGTAFNTHAMPFEFENRHIPTIEAGGEQSRATTLPPNRGKQLR